MKKQKAQFLILIVVLLFVIAGYFAVRFMTQKESEQTENTETYTITEIESGLVTEISYKSPTYQYQFQKQDENWISTENESLSIESSSVDSLVSCATNLISEQKIEQVKDFEQYGLKDPQTSITVQAGEKAITLWIGDKNTMTGTYYIRLNDENTVYMIGDYVLTMFEKGLDTFVKVEEETTTE